MGKGIYPGGRRLFEEPPLNSKNLPPMAEDFCCWVSYIIPAYEKHIAFLRNRQGVDKKSEQNLLSLKSEADDFAIKGGEVYNLRRDRDKSVFSNNFIEKVLKTEATTRNINTLRKIVEKFG